MNETINLYAQIAKQLIPTGRENIIDRRSLLQKFINAGLVEDNKTANRSMQSWLAVLRKGTAIISSGSGYYIPAPEDVFFLEKYITKEKSRVKKTAENYKFAEKLLQDIKAGRIS